MEYRYEFTVDGVSTRGLPRTGEPIPLVAPARIPRARPGGLRRDRGQGQGAVRAGRPVRGGAGPGLLRRRAPTRPPSTERCARATPRRTSSCSTSARASTWSARRPEMYVRVTGDRVETCPISGTIAPRRRPARGRRGDPRPCSARPRRSPSSPCAPTWTATTSRGSACPGSVQVIGRRQIEMYSRLIHTVDHIEGRLRPEFDALDAFLTHMWAVTVTGAPKTWAMQFIEDHEDDAAPLVRRRRRLHRLRRLDEHRPDPAHRADPRRGRRRAGRGDAAVRLRPRRPRSGRPT